MNFLSKIIFLALLLGLCYQSSEALPDKERLEKHQNEIQRDPPTGKFDFQFNTVSNIETIISNYGMIGYDRPKRRGTGYFPRGSRNQYIYGGGIWYAARKKIPNDSTEEEGDFLLNKMVSVSYDPAIANSYHTPGRIEDGDGAIQDLNRYKVFFSTDFSETTGKPIDPNDEGPNWPIWDTQKDDTVGFSRYFGNYLIDQSERNLNTYEKGPAMISGEDMFSTFNDMDLSRYSKSIVLRRSQGYPLGLQYEFTIYSWGFGLYQNFFFCLYDVINMSEDTLYDCWLAPIMDVDLARRPFENSGARNDRVSYWYEDPYLNMAYQFTNGQFGEQGQGFGYLGFDFLESPTIIEPPLLDSDGNKQYEYVERDLGGGVIVIDTVLIVDESNPDWKFLRKDSTFYHNSNQLGLKTFRNWNNGNDIDDDQGRYNYLSSGLTDLDQGEGDKRYMMTTGAFHMRPGDTSRTVVCIMVATPSKTGDADGTRDDRQGLYDLDIFAQSVYDNNFRAPRPPSRSRILTEKEILADTTIQNRISKLPTSALNNSAIISWDTTSELSEDDEEAGLDFLGYRIDRARRPDLDTIAESQINAGEEFPRGAGPFGWKEIARYELPKPFRISNYKISSPNVGNIEIDSLYIVGPEMDAAGNIIDTNSIRVMRSGQGVLLYPYFYSYQRSNRYVPYISGIDSTELPWGNYYSKLANEDFSKEDFTNLNVTYKPGQNAKLFDEALVGTINFDPARVPYNPLFFDLYSFDITQAHLDSMIRKAINGVAVIYETTEVEVKDEDGEVIDTITVETSVIDSVYFVNTARTLKDGSTNRLIVDGALPISNFANAMSDSNRVKRTLDSVYSYIKSGLVKFDFYDFESNESVKKNVIIPYMTDITNNRTFIDIGDDNRDGILEFDRDFYDSEKLVNNTPYYYRVLAYDKGDASQPTPLKVNTGIPNLNQMSLTPQASVVGEELEFEIIDLDTNLMNGLYDFRFFTINEDRAKQLFLGDTLELEFNVQWNRFETTFSNANTVDELFSSTTYLRNTTLTNLTKDSTLLYQKNISFNPNGCFSNQNTVNALYEDAALIVGTSGAVTDDFRDTVNTFGVWNNDDIIDFSGVFTTGDFTERNQCNTLNFTPLAYGTLGFEFKFAALQHGGRYRPGEVEILEGDAQTTIYPLDTETDGKNKTNGTLLIQPVDTNLTDLFNDVNSNGQYEARRFPNPVYSSFNNGPADVIVEFVGSGTEEVTLEWGQPRNIDPNAESLKTGTFEVPYLDIKVTNQYKFSPPGNSEDAIIIDKPFEMEHLNIDPIPQGEQSIIVVGQDFATIESKAYPDPRNLPTLGISTDEFLRKYNIAAFGHININENNGLASKSKSVARPVENEEIRYVENTYSGLQGRYYLSTVNENGDSLDFINVLTIGGVRYLFDNRQITRRNTENNLAYLPSDLDLKLRGRVEDFEVGDKVRLTTEGGASGLPYPKAKVKVVLKDKKASSSLTDDDMNGIKVVPNPYYISHVNEQTPYENKLYFTHVPPGSTINIYNVSGQLLQTINHDPFASSGFEDQGRVAVNIWDLIMENGLRAQSQTLVAHIISPDGAETMEKFSIVVGTFNVSD